MRNASKTLVAITGVTGSLGRALALRLAQETDLVICGCGPSNSTVHRLKRELGDPHHFVVANPSSPMQIRAWGVHVLSNFGAPDFLVNLAVQITDAAPLWEIDEQDFDRLIDYNLKGTLYAVRAFLPAMLMRKRGMVVNISTPAGLYPTPYDGLNGACNAALERITASLAASLPSKMGAVTFHTSNLWTRPDAMAGGTVSGVVLPEQWAEKMAPRILDLRTRDSGRILTLSK